MEVDGVELAEGWEEGEEASEVFFGEAVVLEEVHEGGDCEEAEGSVGEGGEEGVGVDPGVMGEWVYGEGGGGEE